MTARLTIDQVRVGDRVVCAESTTFPPAITEGNTYTVRSIERGYIWPHERTGPFAFYRAELFVPAPALPAMTPELLARVDRILDRFERCASTLVSPDYATGFREAIVSVREEIGILPPPAPEPPGVTDVQATLQEGWWV